MLCTDLIKVTVEGSETISHCLTWDMARDTYLLEVSSRTKTDISSTLRADRRGQEAAAQFLADLFGRFWTILLEFW